MPVGAGIQFTPVYKRLAALARLETKSETNGETSNCLSTVSRVCQLRLRNYFSSELILRSAKRR